jgi:hypothetical protein
MEVQIAALCDSAADYNGKLCIMGTFDTILAQNFPFLHPQCSVALRLLFRDDDEGAFPIKLNIVNEDGKALVPPIETQLDIEIPDDGGVVFTRNIVFNMQHLKFDRPGFYSIDVVVRGRPLVGIPFRIAQYQAPPGQPPQNP